MCSSAKAGDRHGGLAGTACIGLQQLTRAMEMGRAGRAFREMARSMRVATRPAMTARYAA